MAYYKCGKIFATQNSNTSIATASGPIASFNTQLSMPLLSCKCDFAASQNLNGQSSPYPAGGGKNKYSDVFSDYSKPASYWECPITLTQGATYKFSAELVGTAISGVVVGIAKGGSSYPYDEQKNVIKTNGTTGDPAAFTIDDTWTDPKLLVYCADETAFNSIFANYHVQLEVGSTATAYAPYSNICPLVPVSSINVTRTGKNLLDPAISSFINTSVKAWGTNDPNIVNFLNTLKEGTYRLTYKIKVDAINGSGTDQYGIIIANSQSGQVSTRMTESNVSVGSIFNRSTTLTVTASNKGLFTNCWFYTGRSPQANADNCTFYDVQLELGSTATDYEAYNGVTKTLDLGGDYYGGEVDAISGEITKMHEHYNSLGTNISNVVKDSNSWRVYYSSAVYGTNNQYKEGLCDKLAFKTSYSGVNGNNNSIGFPSSAGTQILLRNDDLTTAQEVKDFMATLDVVYPLATPTTAQASNTVKLNTVVGTNNIFNDNDTTEVKYRRISDDI